MLLPGQIATKYSLCIRRPETGSTSNLLLDINNVQQFVLGVMYSKHFCLKTCRATGAEAVSESAEAPDPAHSKLPSELGCAQSQAASLASSCGAVSFHTTE